MPHGDNNKKPISQIKVQSPLAEERLKIDWNVVDQLLMCHCSGAGIAAYLGICAETLYDRCKKKFNVHFSDYAQEKKSKGIVLLLRKQYQLAMEGDRTMLIWLGKQLAGQSEKIHQKTDTKVETIQIYLPENGMNKINDSSD